MISMPSRTDKRDGFAVQAGLSGVRYEVADDVDGTQVSEKALPHVCISVPYSQPS